MFCLSQIYHLFKELRNKYWNTGQLLMSLLNFIDGKVNFPFKGSTICYVRSKILFRSQTSFLEQLVNQAENE